MDAVAYPDAAVISLINTNLVPLRIQADHPELGPRFRIKWTPSLLILDKDGSEQYRTLGFYPPQDLIPSLMLGMGKAYFNRPDRRTASTWFGRLMGDFPRHPLTPEAIYLDGVARYIESHEVGNLIHIYDRLSLEYPDSPWVTRADPYRLLKQG